MKKVILLGLAIFALSGCDSDDIDPVLNEQYCASVKLSDNQYKIDKIKSDYYREYLPLGEEYCENYNKYVFNNFEFDGKENILTYDAPFLVSGFDDVFYTIGYSLENENKTDITALVLSSDFNIDNIDARLKLLVKKAPLFPWNPVKYPYYDISLLDLVGLCEDENIDCQGIDFENINIEIILRNLGEVLRLLETFNLLKPNHTFDSVEEAVMFDPHFSTSLNAEELSDLYHNIIKF
ncbi:STAS domain-containing protein [Photobacterium makurazakiensis]|uniref:hypothetical protein n=1 Tax=Photobacterium makurazakiensis TaxID=2910234 RepID=UPI003D119579